MKDVLSLMANEMKDEYNMVRDILYPSSPTTRKDGREFSSKIKTAEDVMKVLLLPLLLLLLLPLLLPLLLLFVLVLAVLVDIRS